MNKVTVLCKVAILSIFLNSSCNNTSNHFKYDYTEILNSYLFQSFPSFEFQTEEEYHLILSAETGCLYCIKGSQRMVDTLPISNVFFITNIQEQSLVGLRRDNILIDTLNPDLLPSMNLRTSEGPVYIQYKDGVSSLTKITPQNLDSISKVIRSEQTEF